MPAYELVLPESVVEGTPAKFAVDGEGFPIAPPQYATAMMFAREGKTRIVVAQEPMVYETGLAGRYDAKLWFESNREPEAGGLSRSLPNPRPRSSVRCSPG